MKTIFTSFVLAIATIFTLELSAQTTGCTDLIISEVVEGWSNNKAIEIYNPTAQPIDASPYGLVRFQNGDTNPGNITYLDGITIAPYDVVVVVIDKRNPDGIEFEAPVWEELQEKADVFVNPEYNNGQEVMYFNGNDAIALLTNGGETLVDVFGRIGDSGNPDGWGAYTDSSGEQAYISANHTLVRKPSITQGYTTNPSVFDILNEYDSLPANTFDQLGIHDCACEINNIDEKFKTSQVKIYPNPLTNGLVNVIAKESIKSVTVFTISGREIKHEEVNALVTRIDLSDLEKGSYLISTALQSGQLITRTLVK